MQKVIFHSFQMGDVDDPEIYAAVPIHEWEQTDQGQWVMKHCNDPRFNFHPDASYMGHRVVISGELEDHDATFFALKWGHGKA
jgi:hypothetical protein